jgi:hypothetical protein
MVLSSEVVNYISRLLESIGTAALPAAEILRSMWLIHVKKPFELMKSEALL